MIKNLSDNFVIFQITPPSFLDRKLSSTSQLISAIQKLKHAHVSLEITSTRQTGIIFLIRVIKDKSQVVRNLIHAYLPEALVNEVEDYIAESDNNRIVEFYQTKHFAYPLQSFQTNADFDPISYITGAMTKLEGSERISYHLIINPTVVKDIAELQKRILRNEELSTVLIKKSSLRTAKFLDLISSLSIGLTDLVTDGLHGPSHYSNYKKMRTLENTHLINSRVKPARQLSNFEEDLIESINNKISEPQYEVCIRVIFSNFEESKFKQKVSNFKSAIGIYSVSGYQDLSSKMAMIPSSKAIQDRNMSRKPNILSLSEIAGLYHFPHSSGAKTENVIKSISKKLPAPVSFKDGSELDVILGENEYHGSKTLIGLTSAERERHLYIVGGTGNGKTTMIKYAMVQDIRSGKGLALIDPHGDLAESLLEYIPEERIEDVIYFNPSDIAHPIGLNLLELPEGLSADELLLEQDFITEAVVSVFRKIFSDDDHGGHRIEHFLRSAIHTAFTVPDATIFTVYKLLTNRTYRNSVTEKLKDEDLKDFWAGEFNSAGDYQKVKMSSGVNAKLGRFQRSVVSRRILEQPKSTINFDDIIQNNKILICNFSKGQIGEDTSTLLGISVLAKLQIASLRRSRMREVIRNPFYLYVDEFQNFATISFVQLLSEARKYKLFLTMAEQSTAQQEDRRLVDIILANVGTVVAFRSSSPADEKYLLPIFEPFLGTGEIQNLPSYNFYLKVSAVDSREPMSGSTVLLNEISKKKSRDIIIKNTQHSNKYKPLSKNKDGEFQNPSITQENYKNNSYFKLKKVVKHSSA